VGVVLSNLVTRLNVEYDLIGLAPRFAGPVPEAIHFWSSPSSKLNFFLGEAAPWLLHDIDLFWGPNHGLPLAVRGPSVVTVHDVLLFRYPSDQPWTRLVAPKVASALRRTARIVAISRTTANDLIAIFPEVSRKVEVIHNGYSAADVSAPVKPLSRDDSYAVVLGAHRPRKNLALAIAAVAKARRKNPRLRLIVTGQIHPSFQDVIEASRDFVQCVGVIPRNELARLLAGAVALLFPSRYEGFGLPLLEAMAAGCPVIALDTAINREIGGEALSLVTESVENWERELLRVQFDQQWRTEIRQRARLNLQRFSWDRAAHQYATLFAAVA
jgi:glycosyltransferase involved in cell wall biosynthesis